MVNAAVWIICLTIYFIVCFVFPDTTSNIRVIATNLSSCTMCYALASVSTTWVLWQYSLHNKSHMETLKRYSTLNADTEFEHLLTLNQILSTAEGFDMFANHLVKEFSTEHLYFVFEVMQIKRLVVHNKYVEM